MIGGTLASVGGDGDRAAALAVGAAAVAASVLEGALLARSRVRPALLLAWVALTALGAGAWLTAAAAPGSIRIAIAAVVVTWIGEHVLAAALVWTRVPFKTLATFRIAVDVTAVGAAGAGLWVLARVPPRLPGGATLPDRPVVIALGALAAMTLAYAVVGGNYGQAGLLRVNATVVGVAGLAWADDRLRGGPTPWAWAGGLVAAQLVAAGLFAAHLRALRPAGGTHPGIDGRRDAVLYEAKAAGAEPSPMIAGVVESVLWVLIVVNQLHRPIEFAVVVAACIAAAAISLRSMSRWIEQSRTIDSLQTMASTDPLTGLPNRRGFAKAMAECHPGALAVIDLDGFKRVNDRLGHAAGDLLLEAVAGEGRRHLPAGATLARLGGDEFGLVVPGGTADAVRVAEEVVAAIAAMRLAGHVTASAGVAEISTDVEATMRSAGFALHWAKRAGRGRTMQLSDTMIGMELRRSQLAEALASDIERGELHLAYQPIVRVADGAIVGAEALARWHHPVHGEVPPDEFIPIAEELGLIDRVGELVLDQVVAQMAAWEPSGITPDVAVNVSGLQLRGPEIAHRYADRVAAGGAVGRVSIEVTESAIVDDESLETLEQLRASGFRCAIDDFGTGYASISGFMRMRPDRLKIDRRFIRDLGTPEGATSEVLVEAVVSIAHQFGVEVVAEGVETQEALDVLAGVGCDYAQGFWCGRPGPAAELARSLRGSPSRAGAAPTGD